MNGLDVCMWYEAAMDAIDTKMASIRHRLQNMPGVDMTMQDLQAAQEFLSVLCQAEAVLTDYEEENVV